MAVHNLLSASRINDICATGREQWVTDDTGMQGTGRSMLRIAPAGARSWFFRMPRGRGRPQQSIPLGPYSYREQPGALTLSQARTQAAALSAAMLAQRLEAPQRLLDRVLGAAPAPTQMHAQNTGASPGRTPAAARAVAPNPGPAPTTRDAGLTLLELCLAYADALQREKKFSAHKVRYAFDRLIAPFPIAKRLARDIEPEELTEFLKQVIAKHGEHAGAELRTLLSTAYRRAIQAKTSLQASNTSAPVDRSLRWNPVAEIRPPANESVRERSLKNSELAEYWRCLNAPERASDLAVRAARLALLLGRQRCEQLLRVTTVDVDLEAETIRLFDPKGRRGKPRLHLLPLLPMARAEVEWLLMHCNALGSDLLFASRDESRLHSTTVSKAVREIYLAMQKAGTAQAHFQFSDIRRTLETYFASQKLSTDVRAHLLSHGLSGVQQKHYDKYTYMSEKRDALEMLEDFLSSFCVAHRTAAVYEQAASSDLSPSHPDAHLGSLPG